MPLDDIRCKDYNFPMTDALQQEIKQRKPFGSPEEVAYLNLLRTASVLSEDVSEALKARGLTPTQYNVLRILRGAGSAGLSCSEVGERMVTRDSDITRLVDRMEKMGFVARERSTEDRRVVTTRITKEGTRLVSELDEPIRELHRRQLQHMEPAELDTLVSLLEKARQP
jgi:DNA-binding MarR family transcriptional regulator